MIHAQNLYPNVALSQTSGTAGSTLTTSQIDTKGYHYATILTVVSSVSNATYTPTVFKVQENDTTTASNAADVPALVGGGASGFTIPAAPTAAGSGVYGFFNVDCRARKRYLTVVYSPQTTQTVSVIALLSRADVVPVGAIAAANQNASVYVAA